MSGVRRLVLFDIDGTLLSAAGAGARALLGAMREVYGRVPDARGFSMGGRTDPEIVRTLLAAGGLAEPEIEAGLDALWALYLERLAREVNATAVRALPGAAAAVRRVERAAGEVVPGLLTGNLLQGARLKLEAAGLGFDRFRVGAFGSDHARRSALPALAIERARLATGVAFRGKEVVIVGDTPFDISCGAHLGVRTVAVATGTHDAEALAACGPDHLLEDLSDPEAFWGTIAEP
jgi:phosphoglycolate phosphatase